MTQTITTINDLRAAIEREPARSAWNKGVKEYAEELLESAAEERQHDTDRDTLAMNLCANPITETELLNGAENWNQYSWGGCSLICDCDIAERLCNPSELKKTRDGERRPNSREEWLDVQARALSQAYRMIKRIERRAGQ